MADYDIVMCIDMFKSSNSYLDSRSCQFAIIYLMSIAKRGSLEYSQHGDVAFMGVMAGKEVLVRAVDALCKMKYDRQQIKEDVLRFILESCIDWEMALDYLDDTDWAKARVLFELVQDHCDISMYYGIISHLTKSEDARVYGMLNVITASNEK